MHESQSIDLLLGNGRLFATGMPENEAMLGYVAIRHGRIAAVGPMAEAPPAAETMDARGCFILPGLVNCHNHAAMTLFRGLADDLPLMEWLTEHIFPAETRFVSPEMVYWCSRLAAAEMLLSGTTTVADAYFHEEEAARAFSEAGIRAVAAQGVIDFPAPGVPDSIENVAVARRFVAAWQGKSPLVTPAIFCHSPYTCSRETLVAAKQAAHESGVRLFLHVAETEGEVQESLARTGRTPVGYLHELGLLDRDTVCVHGVWLSEADIDILAATGSPVVVCPESHMKLASGIAPLPALLGRGIGVGIGTDGCASNNNLDLWGELARCALLHKGMHLDPTVLPATRLLEMATAGGAACLGFGDALGRLTPGAPADLVILDLAHPRLTPFYGLPTLIYSGAGGLVRDVIVHGEVVVRERECLRFDLAETKARVRELAGRVRGGDR
ncbi:MAG: amidohydrolase [Thermodesulfobacteriota bacterium]